MADAAPLQTLVVDDDAFSRSVLEHFVERHQALKLLGSEESAVEASSRLGAGDVDLLFLDIEMEEMTGLELVSVLVDPPAIVLVSSKEIYALQAFDLDVVDYILKPLTYARFLKSVNRVLEASRHPPRPEADSFVFIKSEGRLVRLDLRHIRYIEAQGDYALIHAGDHKHLVHGTMKSFAQRLPAADFLRIHRSYIVRVDRIEDVEDTSLVIERAVIPIGATYRGVLLDRLRTF